MTSERTLDDYEIRLLDNVEHHGCQVTSVADPDGAEPGFSYSIGFPASFGQGEVIIFGLSIDTGHWVINDVKAKIETEALRLEDGKRVGDVLEGYDLVCRSIPSERIKREHFNSAMWFHRRTFQSELISAFQLVWPDAQGTFPWEAGCDPAVIAAQPALYEGRPH